MENEFDWGPLMGLFGVIRNSMNSCMISHYFFSGVVRNRPSRLNMHVLIHVHSFNYLVVYSIVAQHLFYDVVIKINLLFHRPIDLCIAFSS